MAAQLVQALTSLVLQVVAVRELGAEGFGTFALVYSGIVLATALSTGLVGDSLTALDRQRPSVRAGLQIVGIAAPFIGGAVLAGLVVVTGLLGPGAGLLAGVLLVVFLVEDLLRRLLMAVMRFWAVVIVDTVVLIVVVMTLVVLRAAGGPLGVGELLGALLLAQVVGLLAALLQLPTTERCLAPWRRAAVTTVLRFGFWRSAQQGVRPAMMTATRILIVMAVGTAAYGELEAARVYASPAMLVVASSGGFLFASYARSRERPLRAMIRVADEATAFLVVMTLAMGGLALLVLPWAGALVTGGDFDLDGIAVFGWSAYAAASAMLMPYASLAAVRGRHVVVLGVRSVEATVSIGALFLLVFPLRIDEAWAPFALAVGAVVGAGVVRQFVLAPLAREQPGEPAGAPTRAEEADR